MSNVYEMHRNAFASVSAYVLAKAGSEKVATIALKFPRDGAGRLFAYVHVLGMPMVRAFASGCGYDKRSAAVASAMSKVSAGPPLDTSDWTNQGAVADYLERHMATEADAARWRDLASSLDRGEDWTRAVEKAGFQVLQAV